MPDVDEQESRRGARLLPVLFWSGVGLASLAALLLLMGGGGLRLGGFLGMLAVVAIALSIGLRPDPSTVRLQIEETLLAEIDTLREELRGEIANSARVTHQTVGERLGALQQVVETVRVEAGRAATAPPAGQFPRATGRGAAAVPSAPPGRAAANPPPSAAAPERYTAGAAVPAPAPAGPPGTGHARAGAGVAALGSPRRGGRAERRHAEPERTATGRAAPAGGVYRHTETVQVTRSTYVDEHPRDGHDGGYEDGYGREWSTVVPRSRPPEDFGGSWTDEKLRERYGRRPRPYDRLDDGQAGDDHAAGDSWRGGDEAWQPVSAAPVSRGRRQRWEDDEHPADRADPPDVQGGQRWAAVRGDDRGSELRLGERRASRHSDDRGSELRIEDRWAAVRREAGFDDRQGGYAGRDLRPESRPDYQPEYQPDYQRPALPAASSEPSWNDVWEEPVRQSRGHRYRADDDDDPGYGGAGQRRLGFERTDERWR